MLVYSEAKRDEEQNRTEEESSESGAKTDTEWILPERIKGLLKTEDQKFEDWVKQMNEIQVLNWRVSRKLDPSSCKHSVYQFLLQWCILIHAYFVPDENIFATVNNLKS
jgi:hypothetical protein